MNAAAKSLGLNATTFRNPHGLTHSDQHSSARYDRVLLLALSHREAHGCPVFSDMATLMWAVWTDSTLRTVVSTRSFVAKVTRKQQVSRSGLRDAAAGWCDVMCPRGGVCHSALHASFGTRPRARNHHKSCESDGQTQTRRWDVAWQEQGESVWQAAKRWVRTSLFFRLHLS